MLKLSLQTKLALGSNVTVAIVAEEPNLPKVSTLYREIWIKILQFEKQFSRFLPSSELSNFNRSAGVRLSITPEFRALLLASKHSSEMTDGLYNPFILPALQKSGYKKSFAKGYEDDIHDDYSSRVVVAADNLKVGDNWATIPYGSAIDMGGCGKGYLAELLANDNIPKWVKGYWISMGGDVVAAGTDENETPWQIQIHNANNPKTDAEYYVQGTIEKFAVATSGTSRRKGTHDGKQWHHIIDPRTNLPTETDIVTTTVVAGSTIEADVLATCAVILGSTGAVPFLRSHGIQSSLMQITKLDNLIVKKFGQSIQKTHTIKAGKSL